MYFRLEFTLTCLVALNAVNTVNTFANCGFTMYATCDEKMTLFADGKRLVSSDNWRVTSPVEIPPQTEDIEIHCVDSIEGWIVVGGILASSDNGLITDNNWICSADYGTTWDSAYEIGVNGRTSPNISSDAKWIWTGRHTWTHSGALKHTFVMCKIKLSTTTECQTPTPPPGNTTIPGLDGGWGDWGQCSKSCNGGIKRRKCTNPAPSGNGLPCIGDSLAECNEHITCICVPISPTISTLSTTPGIGVMTPATPTTFAPTTGCDGGDHGIPCCPEFVTGDMEGGPEKLIEFSPKTHAACQSACKVQHPTSIGMTLIPDESRCYCEFAPSFLNGADTSYKTCLFSTATTVTTPATSTPLAPTPVPTPDTNTTLAPTSVTTPATSTPLAPTPGCPSMRPKNNSPCYGPQYLECEYGRHECCGQIFPDVIMICSASSWTTEYIDSPCITHGDDYPCSSTTSTTSQPSPDVCQNGNGEDYSGTVSKTISGLTCQSWISHSPHSHAFGKLGDHNYCRNPDGEPGVWCYTTSPDKRWERCDVPVCDDCQNENGEDYSGTMSKTISGLTCQKWISQSPHSHKFGRLGDHNYCRNPDGELGIWCYTTSPDKTWELCDVPVCESSTPSTTTATTLSEGAETNTTRNTSTPVEMSTPTQTTTPEDIIVPEPGPKCCETTIGGLTRYEFWNLRTETKLSFFQNLCAFEKKSMVLKKFCNFDDIETRSTCLYLVDRGMTDQQRLNVLAHDTDLRDRYHGETCNSKCQHMRRKVHYLQQEISRRVISGKMNTNKRQFRINQFKRKKVEKNPSSSGLNVENLGKAMTGLEGALTLVQDLEGSDNDPKQVALALTQLVGTIGPLFGPYGQAAAAIAGPLSMILSWGEETPDERLANLIGELGNKVEEEHDKTRQQIHAEIRDQTRELQAGFSMLENKIQDSTYALGQEIKQQSNEIISKLSSQTADVKNMLNNAIVIFTDSNQKQTNQILSEVQMQNKRQLQTLETLYTQTDSDVESFYHMMDELNGLKEKLQMIQIFLDANDEEHMYKDLSTLMNQINTFEGAKQLGATRSWMTRFCKKWTSAMLCIDLLTIYVSIISVRDNVFTDLAAAIKRSDHCDADILSLQIIRTIEFRHKRDSIFLKNIILNTRSETGECFISCYIEKSLQGTVKEQSIVSGTSNTILHGARYDLSVGPFICGYLSVVSKFRCNYDNTVFCSDCLDQIECLRGYFKDAKRVCVPCGCKLAGTIDGKNTCDEKGHCICNSKYHGDKCDKCKEKYTKNCETGECLEGFFRDGSSGCKSCVCNKYGLVSYVNGVCHKTTGQCNCKPGYQGRKCDSCASNYYHRYSRSLLNLQKPFQLIQMGNFLNPSIKPSTKLSFSRIRKPSTKLSLSWIRKCYLCSGCDRDLSANGNECISNGSCKCKSNVEGIKCNKCKRGYYKFRYGSSYSCKPCNCGIGSNSIDCNAAGQCSCKVAYDPKNNPQCTRCNPQNAFNRNGRCELCHCYRPGTIGGAQKCDNGGTCDCAAPYLNTAVNNKCRLMKGFSYIQIFFGDDGGNSGFKFKLKNKKGQECETPNVNMGWKNGWTTYYSRDIMGNCGNWMINCGYIHFRIEATPTGCWDSVMVRGMQINIGNAVFRQIWSSPIKVGGSSGPFGSCYDLDVYAYCTSGCEDMPGCTRNRNRLGESTTPWFYPDPYDIPTPLLFEGNITEYAVEKHEL